MADSYGRGNRIGGTIPTHGVAKGPNKKTVVKGPFGERRPLGRFKNYGIPKSENGGSVNQCIKHQMPDGTIMDGPVHGPGQICIEYSNSRVKVSSNKNYKRGGRINKPKKFRR